MVSWKKRYENLKKKKKSTSILGSITGAINGLGRRAPTLALNVASAFGAFMPLAEHLANVVNAGLEQNWPFMVSQGSRVVEKASGYNPSAGTFDWMQPIRYGTGIIAPQLVKKGIQKVGGMF